MREFQLHVIVLIRANLRIRNMVRAAQLLYAPITRTNIVKQAYRRVSCISALLVTFSVLAIDIKSVRMMIVITQILLLARQAFFAKNTISVHDRGEIAILSLKLLIDEV